MPPHTPTPASYDQGVLPSSLEVTGDWMWPPQEKEGETTSRDSLAFGDEASAGLSGKGGPDGDSNAVLTSFLMLSSQKVYWKVMIPEGNGAELLPFIISARKGGTKAENCQIDRDGHGGREEEQVSGNLGFSCCQQPGFSLPRFPFLSLPPSTPVHFGALAERRHGCWVSESSPPLEALGATLGISSR